MRVLMISDVYFPRVNGVSTSIRTFRKELAHLGCETHLVAPRYPAQAQDEAAVLRVSSRYLPFDPEDRVMSRKALVAACEALRGQFDLIHVQTPFVAHHVGVRAARKLGVPVVESYHTLFEEYLHHYLPLLPRAPLRGLARRLSRGQCNAVDAVVAPSRPMAERLEAYGVCTQIEVIPTGLDIADFAGGDGTRFRARFGIDARRPVMLYVGRVAFEKNIEFLLRVVQRVREGVPDILLVIAGDGPARSALRARAIEAALEHNVLFVGYLDREQSLLDCYRAADVFTFASRTETQGLVLLEAMAVGLPLISTAVMGTRAVLEGARGVVIVPEEVAAFAAAVSDLLGRPSMRAALGPEARDHVAREWSSRKMAGRLLALYASVLAAPAGRPVVLRARGS